MNESEWLASRDGWKLLNVLTRSFHAAASKAGRRRLKLYVAGCLGLVVDLFDEPDRAIVTVFEQEAAGLAPEGEARRQLGTWRQEEVGSEVDGRSVARGAIHLAVLPKSVAVVARHVTAQVAVARGHAAEAALRGRGNAAIEASRRAHADCYARQAELLREIFGNPFLPLPKRKFPAEVRGLAQACYDDHAHYPLLADALDDLGETEAAAHCRLSSHVKGCHVVDWILGNG